MADRALEDLVKEWQDKQRDLIKCPPPLNALITLRACLKRQRGRVVWENDGLDETDRVNHAFSVCKKCRHFKPPKQKKGMTMRDINRRSGMAPSTEDFKRVLKNQKLMNKESAYAPLHSKDE